MLFIISAYKNPLSPQDGKPQDANYRVSVVVLLLFTIQINTCVQGDSFLHYANSLACHFYISMFGVFNGYESEGCFPKRQILIMRENNH